MEYPEILEKWNKKDFDYFVGRDQVIKNGIIVYDNMEVIYHAVIKFLEYGCEHDMRLITDTSYGTIGALRSDRSVAFQYLLLFDDIKDEAKDAEYDADQLLFHTVATYRAYDDKVGYTNYACLEIMCEHETDVMGSVNKVIFGNTNYIDFVCPGDYDTCRVGERENKKIRFEVFITKVKKYIREHDDIFVWLLLQGIKI